MSSVLATVLLAKTNKPASRVWRPRRFRTPVVDNRPEPKKTAKSILKRAFTLVPCNPVWLPEAGLHLAKPLEPVVPKKRVWFPEDTAGEPHPKNPDDGCGGAKYKLTAIRKFPKFVPNEDEKKSKNLAGNAYRWLADQIRHAHFLGYTNEFNRKMRVWVEFEKKNAKIIFPEYDYIGLGWRSLFGKAKRVEE